MRVAVDGSIVSLPPRVKVAVIFDGECVLCNRAISTILRLDRRRNISIASRSSEVGQRLLGTLAPSNSGHDSMVALSRGFIHTESDAVIEIASVLGFPYSMSAVFRFVPAKLRDWGYSWIARNRYRWFGATRECAMIAPELRDRFLGEMR